jgi:hypothetical protein
MLAAIAWLLDPFRLYYSLWLLAETLFVFVLLAAVLVYVTKKGTRLFCAKHPSGRSGKRVASPFSSGGWKFSWSLVLGLLAGALVLIRPAGLLLPVLAVLAAALDFRGHPARRRLAVHPIAVHPETRVAPGLTVHPENRVAPASLARQPGCRPWLTARRWIFQVLG